MLFTTSAYAIPFKPLTVPARKFSGLKRAHIHAANSILDGPVTILLSVLCILVKSFHVLRRRGGKAFMISFKFGTSIGCFSIDGAVSTAMKGLKLFTL